MEMIVRGLLIFLARVINVSMGTVLTLLGMRGQKRWATAIGFAESLIFILAISKVLQNVGNVWNVLGYCGGFAAGTWVRLVIEEKLALGYAVVRAISRDDGERIALALRKAGYELCWHSDAQAGDRAEPLQVQDINGDSHLKVLCVQAMDAVGQSLSPG